MTVRRLLLILLSVEVFLVLFVFYRALANGLYENVRAFIFLLAFIPSLFAIAYALGSAFIWAKKAIVSRLRGS